MGTEKALERVQDPADGAATDRLAIMLLDQLFATRADAVVPLGRVSAWARLAMHAWLESDEASKTLERALEDTVAQLSARKQTLRETLPKDLQVTLLEMYGRPYSPDRRVVMALLDRPPMRALIRELVLDTVTAFGARMAAPAASVTKGLGGLARFAAEQVKSRGGAIGGLVGAVSTEVQNQLERRSGDFADAAISGVLSEIADAVCDPKRAHEAAALRVETMKGALELTLPQLARELINLDVPGGANVLREGLARWLESGEATKLVEGAVGQVKSERTVGQVLESIGQLEPARVIGRELLRLRLHALFASPEYAAWLGELLKD
jgi:hypothetical protein